MGIGSARGEGRAVQAAQKAINSPLLEASMDGAHGVLLSIAGGSDLGLFEINEAASLVQEAAHEDANIIFGTVIDDSFGDEVRVTVIAAGFDSTPSVMPPVGRVYGGTAGVPGSGVAEPERAASAGSASWRRLLPAGRGAGGAAAVPAGRRRWAVRAASAQRHAGRSAPGDRAAERR